MGGLKIRKKLMWFLYLLSWISTILHIFLITLAIAAGLYYLAELVEEYTSLTSKVIKWISITCIIIYCGLFVFEDITSSMVLCGIISHVLHLCLLESFPYFTVTSPTFTLTIIMIIVNHYLAFQFFGETYYPFSEVMAYFTICLWIIPFVFFISLSANENILPTLNAAKKTKYNSIPEEDDVVSNYFMKKEKKIGLIAVLLSVKDYILPPKNKKSY